MPRAERQRRSDSLAAARAAGLFSAATGLLLAAAGLLPAAVAGAQGGAVFSQEEICRVKFQTGQEYLRNGRLQAAADAFAEVKEACPGRVDAYLNLAHIQNRLGQYAEAAATCRDALEQDPANLDIKESLAFAQSALGELDDAISLYLELHRARPERPEIVRNLAFVYEKRGRVAEAIMLHVRLIERGQSDPAIVAQAGRLALAHKLFFPSVVLYRELYRSDPNDVTTLAVLGGYYYKIHFYQEAIPYYERMIELAPDHAQTLVHHRILIDCYKKTGQYDRSAEQAEYVLAREPNNADNYCNLAFVYRDAKNPAKVAEAVRRGLEVDPDAGCLWYAWGTAMELEGNILVNTKRYAEAVATFEEAGRKFQRVVELTDARYAPYARQQIERMAALSERTRLLEERDESRR